MNEMKLNIQIFASGTISGTSTSSGGACRIVWSSTKNDTNNTSSVTATVKAKRKTAGYTYCTLAGTVTIDGTNKSISKYRPSSDPWNDDAWKDVGTFTKVVTHNSDGSKQINISCNVNGDAGSMEGNFKASATVTLDKINRTSLLGKIDDFNIDDTISIPITKYISTATDTLVIKAGDTTVKTIASISDGYNLTFSTAEKNTIKSLMTSPRITLTFTLTSIDGATTLGTSIKSAICIFLDMPTIFRIKKTADGNYRLALNGPCDVNGPPLQVYDDERKEILNEVVLYNSSGSNENITLSETSANFKYIEIFFQDNNGILGGSTKTHLPNGKSVDLSIIEATGGTNVYFRKTRYSISGTSFSVVNKGFIRITGTTIAHDTATNYIYITRIVGYR